ncbi:MAG: PTS transporter subunit EIIC, partial [Culicoidibacterales bacterium]
MLGFLQKIGKSLVLPIAILPLAGLMLRLGQADIIASLSFIPLSELILTYFGSAGSAIFDNLPLLFAIGVAVGLSDDQHGVSALAGVVSYLTLTNVTATYWDINIDAASAATLNISFLGGIMAGIIGGLSYNRFRKVQLPEFFAFFGGRRATPIMAGLISVIVAIPIAMIWPVIQTGLLEASVGIAGFGAAGAALFAFFNRLLLPLGLHHIFNSVFWFQLGEFGGVTGDLNRFFALDPTAGHFMAGFFPIMMFGLPAVVLAMYFAAKKSKRKAVAGMLLSLALTSFLTGVTEPIEFLFIFLSPILLIAHALLSGLSMFITDSLGILHGFAFSAGAIDYLLNFNLATKPLLIVAIGGVIGSLYFVIFYTLITKLNLPTPGRETDDELLEDENQKSLTSDEEIYAKYIEYLGGADNLITID